MFEGFFPWMIQQLSGCSLLVLVAGMIVLLEQVLAEVAAEVAPHGVDVVGVVLCVV